jgi:hypothetical protein
VERLREENEEKLKKEQERMAEEMDWSSLHQIAHTNNLRILQSQSKVNSYGLPLQLTPFWRKDVCFSFPFFPPPFCLPFFTC